MDYRDLLSNRRWSRSNVCQVEQTVFPLLQATVVPANASLKNLTRRRYRVFWFFGREMPCPSSSKASKPYSMPARPRAALTVLTFSGVTFGSCKPWTISNWPLMFATKLIGERSR